MAGLVIAKQGAVHKAVGFVGKAGVFSRIGKNWHLIDFSKKGVFRPFDFPESENQLSEIPTIVRKAEVR